MIADRQKRDVGFRISGLQTNLDQLGECAHSHLRWEIIEDLIGDLLRLHMFSQKVAKKCRTAIMVNKRTDSFWHVFGVWKRYAKIDSKFDKKVSGFCSLRLKSPAEDLIDLWSKPFRATSSPPSERTYAT